MPTRDPWDDIPAGDYWQWENPGDTLIGDVISKSVDKDFNGGAAPCLGIRQDNGDEVLLTAGQAQLKAKLLEARPQVGDRIRIVFTQTERRAGGKTLKHFDVAVNRGAAKTAPAPVQDEFASSAPVYGDEEPF